MTECSWAHVITILERDCGDGIVCHAIARSKKNVGSVCQ